MYCQWYDNRKQIDNQINDELNRRLSGPDRYRDTNRQISSLKPNTWYYARIWNACHLSERIARQQMSIVQSLCEQNGADKLLRNVASLVDTVNRVDAVAEPGYLFNMRDLTSQVTLVGIKENL